MGGQSHYAACHCLKYNCEWALVSARTAKRHAKADQLLDGMAQDEKQPEVVRILLNNNA